MISFPMHRGPKARTVLRILRPAIRYLTARRRFLLILVFCFWVNLQITLSEYYMSGMHVAPPVPLANKSLSDFIGNDCFANGTLREAKKNCVACYNSSRLLTQRPVLAEFLHPTTIIKRTANCDVYFARMGHVVAMDPVSEDELDFPLAFSHAVHNNVGIWELYMTTHFRQSDPHCVHVDQKASNEVKDAINGIIKCYKERFPDSVLFVAEESHIVLPSHQSVLQADLACINQLLRDDDTWKRYLNLAGAELPRVTHTELRRQIRNAGASIVDYGFTPNQSQQKKVQEIVEEDGNYKIVEHDEENRSKPPCRLFIMKGYKNVALTRDFATFVSQHEFAKSYFRWLGPTSHSQNHFFSTLATLKVEKGPEDGTWLINQMFDLQKQFPGQVCFREHLWRPHGHCMLRRSGCNIDLQKSVLMRNMVPQYIGNNWFGGPCLRYTFWHPIPGQCGGKMANRQCIFGVRDLERINESGCLFINKFDLAVDAAAVFCHIQHLKQALDREQTRRQYGI